MMKKILTIAMLTLLALSIFAGFASAAANPGDNPLRNQDDSNTGDGDGFIRENPVEPFIYGDVNADGLVNEADVDYLVNYLFIDFDPAPNPIESGDLDYDGTIGIADLTILIDIVFITGDTTGPSIQIIHPEADSIFRTSKSERAIVFEFRVNDESPVESCSLTIDGDVVETMNDVERESLQTFEVKLDRGEVYEWQIKCVDSNGNENTSKLREFDIRKKITNSDDNRDQRDSNLDNDSNRNQPIILNQQDEAESENTQLTGLGKYILAIFLVANILLIIILIVYVSRR